MGVETAELLYLPGNVRSQRLYGMSPVEQIAMTINIALPREQATLDYYNTDLIPDSFATLPKDWTVDQIRQFHHHFDALMSGNLASRRMVKFMPADFKRTETRQSPLKDSVRRVAGARDLLRLLRAGLGVCDAGQSRDVADASHAGGARRPGAAAGLGEEDARPGGAGLFEATRSRIRLGRRRCG